MGTSTRLPGPSGPHWTIPYRNLTRSLNKLSNNLTDTSTTDDNDANNSGQDNPNGDVLTEGLSRPEIEQHAEAFRDALRSQMLIDRESFGLYETTNATATRFIDTVEEIANGSWFYIETEETGPPPGERRDIFVTRFVDRVSSSVGLPMDAVMRHAVTDSVEELIDQSPELQTAIETGQNTEGTISDGIFCKIYQIFFANIVTNLLKSVITAKIKLLFPVLPVVDPADNITDWISTKVTSLIPTPCKKREEDKTGGPSLADLGKSLIEEAIDSALGLPVGQT